MSEIEKLRGEKMVKWYLLNERKEIRKSKLSDSQIEFIENSTDRVFNPEIEIYRVPFIYYSRHYREWKEDAGYLTKQEIKENLKKSGKKLGYEVWREN